MSKAKYSFKDTSDALRFLASDRKADHKKGFEILKALYEIDPLEENPWFIFRCYLYGWGCEVNRKKAKSITEVWQERGVIVKIRLNHMQIKLEETLEEEEKIKADAKAYAQAQGRSITEEEKKALNHYRKQEIEKEIYELRDAIKKEHEKEMRKQEEAMVKRASDQNKAALERAEHILKRVVKKR